jgi:hypothetical protein
MKTLPVKPVADRSIEEILDVCRAKIVFLKEAQEGKFIDSKLYARLVQIILERMAKGET